MSNGDIKVYLDEGELDYNKLLRDQLNETIEEEEAQRYVGDILKGKTWHPGTEIIKLKSRELAERAGIPSVGAAGVAVRRDIKGHPYQRFIIVTEIGNEGEALAHEIGHIKTLEVGELASSRKTAQDYIIHEVKADKWSQDKTGRIVPGERILTLAKGIINRYNYPRKDALSFVISEYEDSDVDIDWSNIDSSTLQKYDRYVEKGYSGEYVW